MEDSAEITSRDIEKNRVPWCMVDEIAASLPRDGTPLIVNTALRSEPGVHWIAIYALPDDSVYIYDPLGPRNRRDHDDVMAMQLERAGIARVNWFPARTQARASHHCGWFALAVAKLLNERQPQSARGANALVREYFRAAQSPNDEKANVRQLLRSGGYVP